MKDEDYLLSLDKQAKVCNLKKQIDQMVYKLYDLTPEEITIVEGKEIKITITPVETQHLASLHCVNRNRDEHSQI